MQKASKATAKRMARVMHIDGYLNSAATQLFLEQQRCFRDGLNSVALLCGISCVEFSVQTTLTESDKQNRGVDGLISSHMGKR
jgi:hypothetical protein